VKYVSELNAIGPESVDQESGNEVDRQESDVLSLLQMIVSTVDYQFA